VSLGATDAPKPAVPPSRRIDENVYAESPGKTRWGVAPFVAAGVGLAGLGGYAVFTQWGRTDNAELAQCAPNCDEASVEHIRKLYVAADVSLGVGVVALGAAAWLFFSGVDAKDPPPPGKTTAYSFDVKPSASGVLATVSGEF
jgi:hypothetical protein